jgi:energy-coupling factor transporter ATP-binding protein EcfA2
MPPEIAPTATVRAEIDRLAEALDSVRFDLAVPGQEDRRAVPRRGSEIARRYLLPRLRDPEAPLLVVVFGPTGAGKSTLVNSLAGSTVSEPGALRPTTRRPVVWCHRASAARSAAIDGDPIVVVDDHPLLEHLTLVDTPDLDSYVAEHKEMAESVLRIADAAVFVTTPQRYADAVPWTVVADLVSRRMPLAVVANRLGRRSSGAVADLTSLLRSHGMTEARTDMVIQIQEHRLKADGRLPRSAVERVREHLAELGSRREVVIARTVEGAVAAVVADARVTARHVAEQRTEGEGLWEVARNAFAGQVEELTLHIERGELVRGEVVARWQRMLGVTDLAALVTRGVARVRDIVRGGDPVEPDQAAKVGSEARNELVDLTTVRAQRAVTAAVTAWEIEPGARALITPELRRMAIRLEDDVRFEVDEWLAGIVTMLHEQGRPRYRVARMASVGINGAATLLLLGVFASTGGITGAEVGVAAGAAAAQQTVLEHLFGSAAATTLARRARSDLITRLTRVLDTEALRFRAAIDAAIDPADRAERLLSSATAVERAAGEIRLG